MAAHLRQLPVGVDPDQTKVEMTAGVLRVAVPNPAQTKKIDVKAAAG